MNQPSELIVLGFTFQLKGNNYYHPNGICLYQDNQQWLAFQEKITGKFAATAEEALRSLYGRTVEHINNLRAELQKTEQWCSQWKTLADHERAHPNLSGDTKS